MDSKYNKSELKWNNEVTTKSFNAQFLKHFYYNFVKIEKDLTLGPGDIIKIILRVREIKTKEWLLLISLKQFY